MSSILCNSKYFIKKEEYIDETTKIIHRGFERNFRERH